jgi:hypothetical protein
MATAWFLICTAFQFLFWKVPKYGRLALYLQALVVILASFVFQWWPVVPGVAAGFLGVVAALLTIEKLQQWERFVLIVLAFFFLSIELRTIYRAQDEVDQARRILDIQETDARRKEDESFTNLLAQGEQTLGVNKSLFLEEVGSQSYPDFEAGSSVQGDIPINVTNHDKLPIKNVRVSIRALSPNMVNLSIGRAKWITGKITDLGDIAAGKPHEVLNLAEGLYMIETRTRNRSFTEILPVYRGARGGSCIYDSNGKLIVPNSGTYACPKLPSRSPATR